MHSQAKRLFAYKRIYDQRGSEGLFLEAMKESVLHHQAQCGFYRDLLQRDNFTVEQLRTIGDLHSIPVIPAHFFKYHEVLSVKKEAVKVHATSSGTLGQKSQIFIDQNTINLATQMAIKMMRHHRLISLIPANYLILGYEPKPGNEMGNVKLAQEMAKFAPAKEKVYVLRPLGNRYEIDYFGILGALRRFARQKLPVRIMGFPSYLYMIIMTMKEAGIKPLQLNKRSIVLTGGGWKTYDDSKVEKLEYYQLIGEYLGIPAQNCRDFYSAVEHSVAYPECKNHHMHVPIWSRVLIRDVSDLRPLGYNQSGFLNFISPLVSSQPISSILMGDLGVLRDGSDCGCGIKTPFFEVLGRAGTAKVRSCAIAASEHMRGEKNG